MGCLCCLCISAKLFQKKGDILLVAKAYNSRVILEWLAHTLESVRGDYADFDEF